jgi:hypothetical protein
MVIAKMNVVSGIVPGDTVIPACHEVWDRADAVRDAGNSRNSAWANGCCKQKDGRASAECQLALS